MPIIESPTWAKWPPYQNYKKGYTAELPSGMQIGTRAQSAYNCLVNWRYNGPIFYTSLSVNTTYNSGTGTFYIIIHIPPKADQSSTDSKKRRLVLDIGTFGHPATAVASIDFDDPDISGVQTLWSSGVSSVPAYLTDGKSLASQNQYIVDVLPPTGTNGSGFKTVKLITANTQLSHVSAWWMHDKILTEDQLKLKSYDVAPGRVITSGSRSLGGINEVIGNGQMNIESMERMTRRIFFSHAHQDGTHLPAATSLINMFGDFEWSARARDLEGAGEDVDCYPCFVATATGADSTNSKIRFSSTAVGGLWEYTFPTGFTGPTLVTPWSTGASSTSLPVKSSTDDDIIIEGTTGTGQTMTLWAVGLFEGPSPNWI